MYTNFPKSPLTASEKADRSLAFGSEQAALPHSVSREVGDLREDVEHGFERVEARTHIPEIHRSSLAISAADDAVDADGTLSGISFLAGRAQASATIGGVTFSSVQPGKAKNDTYSVRVVLAGGNNAALAAAYAAGVLTITLGTGAGGAADNAKNTNTLIAAAVNALKNGHIQATVTGVGAASNIGVTAATELTGGTGAGFSITAYDAAGTATNILPGLIRLSDTSLTLKDDTVVGSVAEGDVIAIVFTSHTARSNVHTITADA
jgi:hypothetical protein